ncbi:hypothetical protein SAVIM338S_07306 [Streptomyces avidinii]
MTSDSLPTRGLPAQKRRRLPKLFSSGKDLPPTVEEQLEDLARASRVYLPSIELRLGQQHRGSRLAEDVWQNALIKVAERLAGGDEPVTNVRAYMHRVCATCAVDELRRIARRAEVLVGDDTAVLEERENVLLDESGVYYADVFDRLKASLTPMESQVLYLTAVGDFTSHKVAELMGVSPSAARKALGRVRKKLFEQRSRPGQRA